VPSRFSRSLLVAAIAAGIGCRSRSADEQPTPTSAPPAVLGEPFVYAAIEKTQAPRPAELTGPVPTELAALRAWPLEAQLRDRVCGGDPALLAAWHQAMLATVSAAPAVAEALAGAVELCGRPELCDWLAPRLSAADSAPLRSVLGAAFASCTRQRDRAVIARPETPVDVVVAWYAGRISLRREAFDPRLVVAAREALAAGDAARAAQVGAALAKVPPADALATLRDLGGAGDPALRATLVARLSDSEDPAVRAAGAAACAHPSQRSEYWCRQPTPHTDEPTAVDSYFLAQDWHATAPGSRPRALDELATCAAAGERFRAEACLINLALVDRVRATAVAARLTGHAGETGVIARTLIAYPTADALSTALAQAGLCAAELGLDERAPVTVEDHLLASRCGLTFDPETDQWPNRHDTLAAQLVLLGERDLADVTFFEEAPAEGSSGPYRLLGYVDGARYSAEARADLGDWYDLDAVLGFVNAIARDRGKAQRWLVSSGGGNDAIAVAGPEAALRELVGRGLLPAAPPTRSVEDSRAREQRLIDRITDDATP
jgi:hypothetical protein